MNLSPEARLKIVERANSLDPVNEQRIAWNSEAWKEDLRKDPTSEFLAPLETVIDQVESSEAASLTISRSQVVKCFAQDPLVGYLAAIIWGCGLNPLNRGRMLRVLRENDNVSQRLQDLVRACGSATPASAWDIIHKAPHKLHRLGIAFGSKVAYFAALTARGPETPSMPLIADLNVRAALKEPITTRINTYVDYCRLASELASHLDVVKRRADQVEYALFDIGQESRRKGRRRTPGSEKHLDDRSLESPSAP